MLSSFISLAVRLASEGWIIGFVRVGLEQPLPYRMVLFFFLYFVLDEFY